MIIMGYMGYRKRTGFLAGLTVAQISEFSLILAALGFSLGHLNAETVGLITLVGLITISASTYLILYSHTIYEHLAPWLSIFERKVPQREIDSLPGIGEHVDVLLIGLGRYGAALADNLRKMNCQVLAVDFDPTVVESNTQKGYEVHYGDAEDSEFVATLPLAQAKWVVSTLRDRSINSMLLHGLRQQNYIGKISVAASGQQDINHFEQEGVDLVLIPYSDAAKEAAIRLMPVVNPAHDHGVKK
jgi:hypothetical protein